jgi:nucleotide-binding universal stress UspA family protein
MLNSILVLTAFQEGSQRALAMAAELGLRFQARVHVLHVVDEDLVEEISAAMLPDTAGYDSGGTTVGPRLPVPVGAGEIQPSASTETVASALVTRAERRMRDFTARIGPGVQLSTEVRVGKPYEAVIETVASRQVDIVVMGRSHHGIKEFLLGSIADKVVRSVACPVCLL